MTRTGSLGSALSLLATLFQIGVVAGMAPPNWCARGTAPQARVWIGHGSGIPVLRIWGPHMENLPEGRHGRRCPGRQQTGEPFRIDQSPLPGGYDPHAFPEADIIACVRLDPRGVILKAKLAGGTGDPALDRRLLRTLYRQWRFSPAHRDEAPPGWQRIRLNSGHSRPPAPGYEPQLL